MTAQLRADLESAALLSILFLAAVVAGASLFDLIVGSLVRP